MRKNEASLLTQGEVMLLLFLDKFYEAVLLLFSSSGLAC